MHAVAWAVLLCVSGEEPTPPYLGVEYVELDLLARRYQLSWTSDAATGREILCAKDFTVVLAPTLDVALVNGRVEKLPRPVLVASGRVRVPAEIARLVDGTVPARKAEPAAKPEVKRKKWFTVVIDPGHGGMHTGCQGAGLVEKDLTLDISLRLRKLLEDAGGTVVLTRTDDRHFDEDVHRDLQVRCDLVNRTKPDVFLSVHVNWVPRADPRGFEIWVRKGDSRELAGAIRAALGRALSTEDRGIKDSKPLYVLRNTRVPAALVEVGFVSNPLEARELADPAHRQKLAQALADAVQKYLASR